MSKQDIIDELEKEFNSIPPVEELKKMYEFSERHNKRMETIFEELRREEQSERRIYAVRRVAVILLALLAVAVVSVKFAPKVYAYFKSWSVEAKDDDSIEFRGKSVGGNSDASDTDVNLLKFELGYMPEGYELESDEMSISRRKIVYRSNDGDVLKVKCSSRHGNTLLSIDTERSILEEISIDGVKYYVFEFEDRYIIVWEKEGNLFTINGNVNKAQMFDIIKGIKFSKKD